MGFVQAHLAIEPQDSINTNYICQSALLLQSCVYKMKGELEEFKTLWKATARAIDVLASVTVHR